MISEPNTRKILLSNDDGIFSEGLLRLAKAAVKFGEVWIVAPEKQRSGASHSETLHEKILLKKTEYPLKEVHAWSCSGTPSDCVKAGMRVIIPGGPDLLLCGINNGYNCGYDLQYSGTIGEAFDGAPFCISAAFSEGRDGKGEVADAYLENIIGMILERPFRKGKVWNINFPSCALKDLQGIRENVQVSESAVLIDSYEAERSEDALEITVKAVSGSCPEPGSDMEAVLGNFISIGLLSNIS